MAVSVFATVVVPAIARMDSTSQPLIAGTAPIAFMIGILEPNAMLPMNILKTRTLNCIKLC